MQEFNKFNIKTHTSCITEEQKFYGKYEKIPKKQQQKQQQQQQQQAWAHQENGSEGKRKIKKINGNNEKKQQQQQQEQHLHKKQNWCWVDAVTAILSKQPQKRMHWKQLTAEVVKKHNNTVGARGVSDQTLTQDCLAAIPLSYTSETSPFLEIP